MRTKSVETTMPMLAMRGLVIFPKVVVHFDVSREKSETALKAALSDDKRIFLTAQKDNSVENPGYKDVYHIGVVAEIRQVLKSNEKDILEISRWIDQVRIDLKKNIIRKQDKEIINQEMYSYMHDILGPHVIEVFDMKYSPLERQNGKKGEKE